MCCLTAAVHSLGLRQDSKDAFQPINQVLIVAAMVDAASTGPCRACHILRSQTKASAAWHVCWRVCNDSTEAVPLEGHCDTAT